MNMNRPRRKSAAYAAKIVQNESDSELSEQEASTSTKKGTKFRMTKEAHEDLVKLCVTHFDEINGTTTIRGTPESQHVKLRQKMLNDAWINITTTMNTNLKVSKIKYLFKKKKVNVQRRKIICSNNRSIYCVIVIVKCISRNKRVYIENKISC